MCVRSLQKAAPILACSILQERVRHRTMRATAAHDVDGRGGTRERVIVEGT